MKLSGTRAALAAIPFVFAMAGCADEASGPTCTTFDATAVALTVNGGAQNVTCVTPRYSTEVSEGTAYSQTFDFDDGNRLLVFFQDLDLEATELPKELTLVNAVLQTPVTSSSWRIVCNAPTASSTLTIEKLAVDDEDTSRAADTYFRGFVGSIDLTLTDCTLADWNLESGAVHVTGNIAWGDR